MNKRKLQSLIDRTARTATAFHRANAELCQYCQATFGFEPGDVDADAIIDNVQGGCGPSQGMYVEDFIRIMNENSR